MPGVINYSMTVAGRSVVIKDVHESVVVWANPEKVINATDEFI